MKTPVASSPKDKRSSKKKIRRRGSGRRGMETQVSDPSVQFKSKDKLLIYSEMGSKRSPRVMQVSGSPSRVSLE